MVRSFTIQLLNIFAQICFDTFHSDRSQVVVEMNLLGYHAFTFHQCLAIFFATNFSNSFLCLCNIFGPNYFCTAGSNYRFKKFQLFVQRSNRFPFCIFCFFTSQLYIHKLLLPFRHHRIVLTNIKIDFTTMFPISCFDRATR